MRAAVISAYGPAGKLMVQRRPIPTPGPGEVLIEVRAAGINRPDILQRQGRYPAPPGAVPDIPGLEVAGIVAACGLDVDRWMVGDQVCALLPGGGYAEYVTVDALHCLRVPDTLSMQAAACLSEAMFTVLHNLFQLAELQPGETVLVHGGSGGIGSTAIQLANCFGAKVYTTAGSGEKCDFCERLGAYKCINYKTDDFGQQLAARSIDVILDSVGGPYFEKNMTLLADDGRMVYINAVGGRRVALDLMALMQRRITLTGSTLRGRSNAFKSTLREAVERHVWPLVEVERLRPMVHKAFPLEEAYRAHEHMEAGDFMGKLVLYM